MSIYWLVRPTLLVKHKKGGATSMHQLQVCNAPFFFTSEILSQFSFEGLDSPKHFFISEDDQNFPQRTASCHAGGHNPSTILSPCAPRRAGLITRRRSAMTRGMPYRCRKLANARQEVIVKPLPPTVDELHQELFQGDQFILPLISGHGI
jgi:hypothetical protein